MHPTPATAGGTSDLYFNLGDTLAPYKIGQFTFHCDYDTPVNNYFACSIPGGTASTKLYSDRFEITPALGTSSGGTGLSTVGSNGDVFRIVSGVPAWSTMTTIWASPGAIGATTPSSGVFTSLDTPLLVLNSSGGQGILTNVSTAAGVGFVCSDSIVGDTVLAGNGRILFKDTKNTFGAADMRLQS